MSEDGFVLIGNSADGHFPASSYHAYTTIGKRFYCLDLGGLTASRGGTKGGPVYPSVEALPKEHSDLAVLWVHPHQSAKAVEVAHSAGCKRVWFSFQTGHREGVAKAKELGMQVVEIGRCPVYFIENDKLPMACKVHLAVVKLSGTQAKPPQLDPDASRRELL